MCWVWRKRLIQTTEQHHQTFEDNGVNIWFMEGKLRDNCLLLCWKRRMSTSDFNAARGYMAFGFGRYVQSNRPTGTVRMWPGNSSTPEWFETTLSHPVRHQCSMLASAVSATWGSDLWGRSLCAVPFNWAARYVSNYWWFWCSSSVVHSTSYSTTTSA
jgi:hypothetical protein